MQNLRQITAVLGVAAIAQVGAPVAAQEPADTVAAPDSTVRQAPLRRDGALAGTVVNAATGRPLGNAAVFLLRSGDGAVTDSLGNFEIPETFSGPDSLEVRYIGFEPSRTPIHIEPRDRTRVTLLLSPTVLRVADLTVEVRRTRRSVRLADFQRRRMRGFGDFFTPAEIRARNPRLPSDMLRGIPGVTVGRIEYGKAPVFLGRGGRLGCPPAVFLDGVYQAGMDVDDIPPEDLGAMEVYKGATDTPVEFMRSGSTCGAIVIWTPDGPDFMDWDPDLDDPPSRR